LDTICWMHVVRSNANTPRALHLLDVFRDILESVSWVRHSYEHVHTSLALLLTSLLLFEIDMKDTYTGTLRVYLSLQKFLEMNEEG
jgi:hypothetical protein